MNSSGPATPAHMPGDDDSVTGFFCKSTAEELRARPHDGQQINEQLARPQAGLDIVMAICALFAEQLRVLKEAGQLTPLFVYKAINEQPR